MQLKNTYNDDLPLSSLLIHIEIAYKAAKDENYQSLQALREQMRRQNAEREELVKEMLKEPHGQGHASERLKDVNQKLRLTEDQVRRAIWVGRLFAFFFLVLSSARCPSVLSLTKGLTPASRSFLSAPFPVPPCSSCNTPRKRSAWTKKRQNTRRRSITRRGPCPPMPASAGLL